MVQYESIRVDRGERVVTVTLQRPEAGNRLTAQMAGEIEDLAQSVRGEEAVQVLVLRGAGGTFCAGEDVEEMAREREENLWLGPTGVATAALAALDQVLIAAIEGDCLGAGLDLALACDLRVAAEGALLGFPEVTWGALPEGGGTQRLPRIVGRGAALEMLLLGRPLEAQEAFQLGLVNRVVPIEGLEDALQELVDLLLTRAPLGLRYAKEAALRGSEMTLEQGLRLEGDLNFLLQTTEDRAEGVRAWIERRPPLFHGR